MPVNIPDALSWELGNNKVFSVKSFYEKLMVRAVDSFPYVSVWILKAPRKVCFFTWFAIRGVILMAKNLRNRRLFA